LNKEKRFLNLITYAPLFVIPFFVSIIVLLSFQVYSKSFDLNIKNLKKDLLEREKEAVKNKVSNLSKLIVYQKSRIKDELINRVKGRVETAHNIAINIYDEYKDIKSEEEIKDIINTTLKTFTWNDAESYIWIMDYLGVHYLIENKKDLEGTSLINFQDAEGRYIVQEEIAICKEKGEGYLWDTFIKPKENNTKQYKQVAFVKNFEPYNWCLGSAEFLDTATKRTDKFLFDMVSQVDKIGNNYVFIINKNGNFLLHNKIPQFVGKDVEITDKLVLDAVKYIRQAIEGKENVSYVYNWHNFSTGEIEKKYTYLQRVPDTDWFIGSGFFLSEENEELVDLNDSLEDKVQKRTTELETIKNDFEKLATTDTLTNIHSRYSIMKILSNEINRSKRYKSPLSILMYDIDRFKAINDTYGHDVGDIILSSLSILVSGILREIDYIGRYGGEEFLIIMPNTSLKDASIYGERLRKIIEDYRFEEVEKITVSIGVVELKEDENIDLIFKRVDDLLYLSKNKGRNRISF